MKVKDAVFRVTDTETTDVEGDDIRVVEVAYTDFTVKDGIIKTRESLVDPGCPIPPGAMAVHHITDKMVEGAPDFDTTCEEIGLMDGICDGLVFVAHNAEYDSQFFSDWTGRWLCTQRAAMHAWPHAGKFSNQYLRYWLGVDDSPVRGFQVHRAAADTIITALILQELLAEEMYADMDVEEMISHVDKPALLLTIPFSDYRGKPWEQVPTSFLLWMAKKQATANWSKDLVHTMQHHLRKRGGRI